jgi:hypothetical protein
MAPSFDALILSGSPCGDKAFSAWLSHAENPMMPARFWLR